MTGKPTCFCSACVQYYKVSMTCSLCLGVKSKKSGHQGDCKKGKIFIFCQAPQRPNRLVLDQVGSWDGRRDCILAGEEHGAERRGNMINASHISFIMT